MNYKAKEYIHCKATFVKGTGYFINEAIKNENWKKSKIIEK